MIHTQRILTISRDSSLQASRTLLFEAAGYTVVALGSDLAVTEYLKFATHPTLDLVLMCHSVPEKSRVLLCAAVKAVYPGTPILMLYNGFDPTAASVDGRLENLHDPKALVDALGVLVAGAHPAHGRPS